MAHGIPDDIRLIDAPDTALASRLDAEIAAFNFEATGIRDAREFAAAVHDGGGGLTAGVQGGRGARHRAR